MKINQLAIAAVATLLAGSSLLAQQPGNNQPGQASFNRQQQEVSTQVKTQTFAKCMAIANEEQVKIARYAQDKATNSDVKQFAAKMEKEHQSCLDKLNKFLPEGSGYHSTSTSTEPSSSTLADVNSARKLSESSRQGTETSRQVRDSARTATRGSNNSTAVNFVELHQEISTQCLKDSKEYLDTKDGAEFDKCFMAMQVAKHAGMQSSLTVMERHATGKLQEFVQEGLEKNREHLDSAISLMKQLEANESATSTHISK